MNTSYSAQPESETRQPHHNRLHMAILLIAIGVYLLLGTLGLHLPAIWRLWPMFPLIGGTSAVIDFTRRNKQQRTDGLLFGGLMGIGVGLLFLVLGLTPLGYGSLAVMWPVFSLIAGVAALIEYVLNGMRGKWMLLIGISALGLSAISWAVVLQLLPFDIFNFLWPLVMIAVGVIILLRRQANAQS